MRKVVSARDLPKGEGMRVERGRREEALRQQEPLRRSRGFSMIELLIVVSIILIIAAIAIPSFLRSKMAANEASAANTLKQIGTASILYSSQYGVYAPSLAELGPTGGPCPIVGPGCADLLDPVITGVDPPTATPEKSGYRFTYYATPPNASYAVVAKPISPGGTGVSTFCIDSKNVYVVWKDTSGLTTTATAAGCAPTWTIGGTVGPL